MPDATNEKLQAPPVRCPSTTWNAATLVYCGLLGSVLASNSKPAGSTPSADIVSLAWPTAASPVGAGSVLVRHSGGATAVSAAPVDPSLPPPSTDGSTGSTDIFWQLHGSRVGS